MFVAGNILQGLAYVLDTVLFLYMWLIIIRALISWVNPDPWNPIVQFLAKATDPVLFVIRRRVGVLGGIDVSPILAILLINMPWCKPFGTLGSGCIDDRGRSSWALMTTLVASRFHGALLHEDHG